MPGDVYGDKGQGNDHSAKQVLSGKSSGLAMTDLGSKFVNRFRSGSLTLPDLASGGGFGSSIWAPSWIPTGLTTTTAAAAAAAAAATSSGPRTSSTSSASTSSDDHVAKLNVSASASSARSSQENLAVERKELDLSGKVDDLGLVLPPLSALNIPSHLLSPELSPQPGDDSSFTMETEDLHPRQALLSKSQTARIRSQSMVAGKENGPTTSSLVSASLRRGLSTHTLESVAEDETGMLSHSVPALIDLEHLSVSARPRASTLLESSLRAREIAKMKQREEEELEASRDAAVTRGRLPRDAETMSTSRDRHSPVSARNTFTQDSSTGEPHSRLAHDAASRYGNGEARLRGQEEIAATQDDGRKSSTSAPSRALWIGTVPPGLGVAHLLSVFSPYGPIESARILTHKQCAFVNFERIEDAVRARQGLHGWDFLGPEVGGLRIGFAKVPPGVASESSTGTAASQRPFDTKANGPYAGNGTLHHDAPQFAPQTELAKPVSFLTAEIKLLSKELGAEAKEMANYDRSRAQDYRPILRIPPSQAQQVFADRRADGPRLREMKKKMDEGLMSVPEMEEWAMQMQPELADLSSDYIGNTVVQSLFERCGPRVKTLMLQSIAPHMASLGCHKNGTWVAQKIIELTKSEDDMALIAAALQPYCPLMLLDQFANYVIQGCLRFGPAHNQFIFDAIADRLVDVADGRFGARAIRACLDHEMVSRAQRRQVVVAIIFNSIALVNSSNGNLLNGWVLDMCDLKGRFGAMAKRYLPHIGSLLVHKFGSINVLKIMAQTDERGAAQSLIHAVATSKSIIEHILMDQTHGVVSISKMLGLAPMTDEDRAALVETARHVIKALRLQRILAYRRLIQEHSRDFGDLAPTAQENVAASSARASPDRNTAGAGGQSYNRMMNPSHYMAQPMYGHEPFPYMQDPNQWSRLAASMNGQPSFGNRQDQMYGMSSYPHPGMQSQGRHYQ